MTLKPAAARIDAPWKNGGGVTREVAREAGSAKGGAFLWRVSVADVTAEGPFSRFDGYRRLIAVIGGRGMELRSPARQAVMLEPYRVHAFDGSDDVSGRLPFGAVSDLNVIYRADVVRASLRFSKGEETLRGSLGGTLMVMNLRDRGVACLAEGQRVELAPLDAVVVAGEGALALPEQSFCAIIEMLAAGDRPASAL